MADKLHLKKAELESDISKLTDELVKVDTLIALSQDEGSQKIGGLDQDISTNSRYAKLRPQIEALHRALNNTCLLEGRPVLYPELLSRAPIYDLQATQLNQPSQ